MIALHRLRLINWHNFTDDLLDIQQITYLIGVNGVGKTTILDALRYCLTTDKNFNALGNRKSKRTLLGSVHGKQRDREGDRPRYSRKGHTVSYIGAEFLDETAEPGKNSFVITVRVESESPDEDMRHVQQRWYLTPHGYALEDLPFLGPDRVPARREQFRLKGERMRETENQKAARDMICRKLGIGAADSPLGKKFCAVFPMGTAMDDIDDFRTFIYHYILPQPEIDPEALQKEQIELEHLSDILLQAKERAELLNEIGALGETALAKKRDCVTNRGFVLCARQRSAAGREEKLLEEITAGNREIEALQRELERQEEQTDLARQRYVDAERESEDSEESRQLRLLEELQKQREREYQAARKAHSVLQNAKGALETLERRLADYGLALAPEQMPEEIRRMPKDQQMGRLDEMERALRESGKKLDELEFERRSERREMERRRDGLHRQIETLERGRLVYPDRDRANAVCGAINREFANLGMETDARILCELLNVREPDWQSCVEACLGERRFDILVSPKHYRTAKRVFEQLGAEVGRVSLLDTPALERDAGRGRGPEASSLATKVTSENWLAQSYVNDLLGRIICCDTSETLEEYPHSATRELLRHFPYRLARLRAPDLFIGLDARKRQLKEAREELAELGKRLETLKGQERLLSETLEQCRGILHGRTLADLRENWESGQRLEACQQALTRAREECRACQERPSLQAKRTAVQLCRRDWEEQEKKSVELKAKLKVWEEKVGAKQQEQGQAILAAESAESAWQTFCEEEPLLRAEVEKKYQEAARSRTPEKIAEYQSNYQNQVDKALEEWVRDRLIPRQQEYNGAYICDYPLGLEGLETFLEQRDRLVKVELERYTTSLHQAQERCKERFREDILYRLRDDIARAKRQFRELNRTMGNLRYGEEVYQFVVQAGEDAERRAFYDVIMRGDPRREGESGAPEETSQRRDPAYEAQVEELMERILAELKANAQRRQEGRKVTTELSSFADYRYYLDYDIECQNRVTGGVTRLSSVSQDSSGGENQAPFYIAICASLLQIYDKCENSVRLVLLDEAFSRMTSDRIRPMMRMLREMRLQVVLITTVEKASAIQPYCDATWSIVKSGSRNAVRAFYQDVE